MERSTKLENDPLQKPLNFDLCFILLEMFGIGETILCLSFSLLSIPNLVFFLWFHILWMGRYILYLLTIVILLYFFSYLKKWGLG